MARVVKTAEVRQDEILDTAERLFAERGYANTPVQAIIDEVSIAKGTFYHHFPSKHSLLDALVRRLIDRFRALVQPVVVDPRLGATEKFLAFFRQINAWKSSQAAFFVDLGRTLEDDANAGVARRLEEVSLAVHEPLLARIIEQGVAEGVFDTRAPAHCAPITFAILGSLSRSLVRAMSPARGEPAPLETLEAVNDAHQLAIERVLGAREGTLQLLDRDSLALWRAAYQERT